MVRAKGIKDSRFPFVSTLRPRDLVGGGDDLPRHTYGCFDRGRFEAARLHTNAVSLYLYPISLVAENVFFKSANNFSLAFVYLCGTMYKQTHGLVCLYMPPLLPSFLPDRLVLLARLNTIMPAESVAKNLPHGAHTNKMKQLLSLSLLKI